MAVGFQVEDALIIGRHPGDLGGDRVVPSDEPDVAAFRAAFLRRVAVPNHDPVGSGTHHLRDERHEPFHGEGVVQAQVPGLEAE